ncbi:MAG: hypothetical protein A2Z18_02065 [Armatimonadetes bacterium RBG_16_58_9]|nr:MAG: hypothetical protein A2Z18_02065 [Armatimonadetes bacterium RBG_16_58_9]
MPITIEDCGDKRMVTVDGRQVDRATYHDTRQSVETTLSEQALEGLRELNGETWLIYHLLRHETKGRYATLGDRLSRLIEDFQPKRERTRFLDFGCGTGASTAVVARLGYPVVGVEIMPKMLEVARLIARDYGLSDLETFLDVESTKDLPFEDGEFDGVVTFGVFEHIPPRERTHYVDECWRVLAPGGILYVVSSPSRLWPIDGHTSSMPLVHWLPLWLARPIINRFSRKSDRKYPGDELLYHGLVGINLLSLLRRLPNSELCAREGGNTQFFLRRVHGDTGNRGARRALRAACFGVMGAVEKPFRRLGLPIDAFLPMVDVAIRKKPSSD